MAKLISKCPSCNGKLHIASLQCSDCGMELKKDFEMSVFDTLRGDEYIFLMEFLRQRGNLKNVQSVLGISYPTAKKKLDELLVHLELAEPKQEEEVEVPSVADLSVDRNSTKASEIIKAKLMDSGGRIVVHTARGLPCAIIAHPDGKSFTSKKLPIKPPYEYAIFDTVVETLKANGGRARKGNGRNYKLGHPECSKDTVVGAVAFARGYSEGDSVYDPVFVLAAVLEWAGIASNERGELVLSPAYRSML